MLVAVEEVVAFPGQGAVRSLVAPLAVVPSGYVADSAADAAVRSHDTVLEAKENKLCGVPLVPAPRQVLGQRVGAYGILI